MALDAVSNFVRGSTDASVDNTQTTISVVDATIFPDPATEGEYNVVIWAADSFPRPDQDPDVEVLRVTATDGTADELTVTRGQEGTSAAGHPSGSAVQLSPTAKMFSDIESRYTAAGEDFDGQGTSDFTNLQSVDTDKLSLASQPVVDALGFASGGDGTVANPYLGGIQAAIDSLPSDTSQYGNSGGTVRLPRGVVEIDSPITVTDKPNVTIQGGPTYITLGSGFTGNWIVIAEADTFSLVPNFQLHDVIVDGGGTQVGGILLDRVQNKWEVSGVTVDDIDGTLMETREAHGGTLRNSQFQPVADTANDGLVMKGTNEVTVDETKVRAPSGSGKITGAAIKLLESAGAVRSSDNTFQTVSGATWDTAFRLEDCTYNTFIGCTTEVVDRAYNLDGGSGSADKNTILGGVNKQVATEFFRIDNGAGNMIYYKDANGTLTTNASYNTIDGGLAFGGTTDNGSNNLVRGMFAGEYQLQVEGNKVLAIDTNGDMTIAGSLTENTSP